MLKNLIVLSGILSLSGCVAISESGNCDPKLNYVKSNIPAMQEYSKLKKEGEIKSLYFEYVGPQTCEEDKCFTLDQKSYSFFEMSFNKENKNDIYTLIKNTNKNNDCESNVISKECIKKVKNENGIIKSKYKLTIDDRAKENIIIRFEDVQTNTLLYEKSYQIYSTGGVGGPGGTYCHPAYVENPDYKFDAGSFPNHGILTKN